MYNFEAEQRNFRKYYKILRELKEMTSPTLPANKPRHLDVIPHPPRKMFPVHIEGMHDVAENMWYGTPWVIDLIMVPMESVRRMFGFKSVNTPEARKNLQTWVNNQGPALYNPVWWQLYLGGPYPPRHGGRFPHRKTPWIDRVHGTHRIRALEALDFDFIYVYFQMGPVGRFPSDQTWQMKRNERPPTMYTVFGKCDKCGKSIRWTGGRDVTKATKYKCRCGHEGSRDPIYPEPV